MKITFQINYHAVWGQRIVVAGSITELGLWNPEAAPSMQAAENGCWSYELVLPDGKVAEFEYKFCLISPAMPWKPQSSLRWEAGRNRSVHAGNDARCMVDNPTFEEENPSWKCAGLVIPVFSLKSKRSCGIGDFGDLLLMIDWAKMAGQKIIQILPINDTTWTHTWEDSYPYNAISIYALHPLYIHMDAMGTLKDPARRTFFRKQKKRLNALSTVDYEAVDRLKWGFFSEIFRQNGTQELHLKEFLTFFEANREWLISYSDHCCRRDSTSNPEWYYYLQFHAHRQMIRVRNHARQAGIILKGDVPIGVSSESVEVAIGDVYFDKKFQVGAPPDAFSVNGQAWGFPAYNWAMMEKEDYKWWKKRFRKMADYFDAYRMDHILGFFRIWQIPMGEANGLSGYFRPALAFTIADIEHAGLVFDRVEDLFIEDSMEAQHYHPRIAVDAKTARQSLSDEEIQSFNQLRDDYFYRRNNEFWKRKALDHLAPLVNATDMLACGEDLGMIPSTVPEVMHRLQILSLEIERMSKSQDKEFTDLQRIPYRSVCTTSTHDMTPLRGWWQEDRAKTQRYYNTVLNRSGDAPEDCTTEICQQIISNHLNASSMMVIIPLQDWLAIDEKLRSPDPDSERINLPTQSRHYWRYRMHLTIEELLTASELNENIRTLIRMASR